MKNSFLLLIRAYINSYKGLSKTCWQGIILSLLESILMGVFYFLSIYFVNHLHLSIATSGIILSFYGLGAILGGISSGKLCDKSSPKLILAISLPIQAIGYLSLIKITSVNFLIIDSFVLGVVGYGFITANHLWVLSQCNENENQKLKALNLLSTSANLGLSLSALIISIAAKLGFNYIFLVSGICLFLLSIYSFNQKQLSNITIKSLPKNLNIKKNLSPLSLLILLCVFFIGTIISQNSSTYPVYIEATFSDLGIKAVSFLFILNSILVVLFETPIGSFSAQFNKTLVVGVGAFLIGFGMYMLTFSSLYVMAILACIVYTIGEMLFFSMAQLVYYQNGSEHKKGHTLGTFRTVYASSRFLGPAAGGVIYSQFGGNSVWYICGLIGTACLAGCFKYRNY